MAAGRDAEAFVELAKQATDMGELTALLSDGARELGFDCVTLVHHVDLRRPARQAIAYSDFRIEGDAPFRPLRVFDDGRRTIIDFPKSIAAREMPPIFIMSGRSDAPELVNFRVQGQRMIVDRLFDVAELRLGAGKAQARVRIVRDPKAGGQ